MRTQGSIRWTTSLNDVRHIFDGKLLRRHFAQSPVEMFPGLNQMLPPRDEAIFLLHLAAEIEHSLMIQYLYAAYAFGPPQALKPNERAWCVSLANIAKQEMGHLLTVQNLALALGGPVTFQREDYPYRSEFYPFPFTLERPTRDVFAKYVLAEMPPLESITCPDTLRLVLECMVRTEVAYEGVSVNRVGALYAKLSALVEKLKPSDFSFNTVNSFQAIPNDIPQTSGPGAADPMGSIMNWPIDSKETSIKAIDLIAKQGEGPTRYDANSHFAQFVKIYEVFPETNPLFGPVSSNPTKPVPVNPTTSDGDGFDPNRITDPIAFGVASFANLRYRLVLDSLHHYLLVDRRLRPKCKFYLANFSTFQMRNTLMPLAIALTSISRQTPAIFIGGIQAVAAIPFEMPYSLSLSPDESLRWQSHISLLEYSKSIAQELIESSDIDREVRALLKNIVANDADVITQMRTSVAKPADDCQLP